MSHFIEPQLKSQDKLSWVQTIAQVIADSGCGVAAAKSLAQGEKLAYAEIFAGQTESFKPAMGESWRNQPHTRVILSRQDKGSAEPERRATLALTQVEPANTHAIFTITNQGVVGISADEGTAGV